MVNFFKKIFIFLVFFYILFSIWEIYQKGFSNVNFWLFVFLVRILKWVIIRIVLMFFHTFVLFVVSYLFYIFYIQIVKRFHWDKVVILYLYDLLFVQPYYRREKFEAYSILCCHFLGFIILGLEFSFKVLIFGALFFYFCCFWFMAIMEYLRLKDYDLREDWWLQYFFLVEDIVLEKVGPDGQVSQRLSVLFEYFRIYVNGPLVLFFRINNPIYKVIFETILAVIFIFCIFYFVPSFISEGFPPSDDFF